jgi:alpha-mannosidase
MFSRLVALFPCHSLEDFELERREEDAEQLLSSWSALWWPELLADAQAIPAWLPAISPPSEASGHLIVIPDCCAGSLPDGWLAEAEAAGACVLRNLQHRDEIVAAALARLGSVRPAENGAGIVGGADIPVCPADGVSSGRQECLPHRSDRQECLPHCSDRQACLPHRVDPELAADFLALGHCHLQVELLTRKLRYMSNLNESALRTSAVAAAAEALTGNADAARQHLQSAFDRLHEAREYFYPSEARLLDLTLVAPTTLGEALRKELASGVPRNLLVSGEVIEEMARREPETLAALKQALAAGSVALVGGEFAEIPLPLLDPEAIARHLSNGLATYQEFLQQRPVVFGRRRFGLTPALPQVLGRLGFTAAVHCTLDDGRFPTDSQSRIQWEGIDGTSVESLGCLPIDAARAELFLSLPKTLSDTMSLDRSATLAFAHWPGRSSCWYEDLRRIAAYSSALGSFCTLSDYFEDTSAGGESKHYQPDQYRSPYLKQDVAAGRRDPISRWVRYFCRRAKSDATETLDALAVLCGGTGGGKKAEGRRGKGEIERQVEGAVTADTALDEGLAAGLRESLAAFARSLTGVTASTKRGTLVVNPLSFSQQACFSASQLGTEVPSPSLEVPSVGFVWVDRDAAASAPVERRGWFGRKPKAPPPLAEENLLRNEFCEIHFDPATGAIRSISDYHSRDPRLAQQIALRLPHGGQPGDELNYSIMAAEQIEVTSPGPALGEIVCRGRLLDRDGRRLAGFRQTTRVRRGSRMIELLVELDVDRQPGSNPWDSYYAARFAWKDETAVVHRGVSLANMPTELTQIESPHFIDICRGRQRTTLLCGGLPYHRRLGLRKLDTLLVVQGETARSFRLGIGIDVPNAAAAALGLLGPPLMLPDQPPPPTPSGWLFHLDRRNVLATHWEPLPTSIDNSRGPTARGSAGQETTFRVRLLETDGRGVTAGLRCFRPVASARKINSGEAPPVNLTVEGDRVDVPIGPHRWIEIEVTLS